MKTRKTLPTLLILFVVGLMAFAMGQKTPRERKPENIEGRLRIDRAQLWVDSIKFGLNEDAIITINGRATKANDLRVGDTVTVTLVPATADKATVAGYASRVAAHRENAHGRFTCWNAMGGCVCNYNGHGAFYGTACTDWELAGFD